MARDVADLVRKFERSANAVPPTLKDTIGSASLRTKNIYLAAAVRAGLTPGKKLNVGRRGATWGVGYDMQTASSGSVASIVRFKGPVHLVNNDTRPHRILTAAGRAGQREEARQVIQALTGTRIRRSRRANGPRALGLPTGPVASVKHPGTKGKNFFRPADDFARQEVKRITGDARQDILLRGGFGRN